MNNNNHTAEPEIDPGRCTEIEVIKWIEDSARYGTAAEAIKRCPAWCIEEHGAYNPADCGDCSGRDDTFDGWNRSIGNGTASASITQSTTNFNKLAYVDILIEVEMTPTELLTMAGELEKLAVYIRACSMNYTNG